MFEEELINEIYKFPCIYNKRYWAYKNKIQREKAWAAVAAATKCSVSQCQGRWKTLRDRFVKEVNKSISPSGSAASAGGSNWKFMEVMEFMRVHVTPRPTISSIQSDEESCSFNETEELPLFEESSQEVLCAQPLIDEQSMPSSKAKKRKATEVAHDKFDTLCGTVNAIVEEKFSRVSRNEAFYKYLDTILTKVEDKAQNAIKLDIIALCSERVNEELEKIILF